MSESAQPFITSQINKLSVIVPCHNEEDNLKRFPVEVFPVFQNLGFLTEYILIDDGSTDKTWDLIQEMGKYKEVSIIDAQHSEKKGLGQALKTGIQKASGDVFLTLDADLTFHPREWDRLKEAYKEGIDCVMGSPLLGNLKEVPWIRRFLSNGVNRIYRILLGQELTATSSLFRLYRASTLSKIQIESHSFDVNAEILFKLLKSGGKVVEVPVTLTIRKHGKSKINVPREIINHLRMFMRVFLWRIAS